jgi:hypothetical protein
MQRKEISRSKRRPKPIYREHKIHNGQIRRRHTNVFFFVKIDFFFVDKNPKIDNKESKKHTQHPR